MTHPTDAARLLALSVSFAHLTLGCTPPAHQPDAGFVPSAFQAAGDLAGDWRILFRNTQGLKGGTARLDGRKVDVVWDLDQEGQPYGPGCTVLVAELTLRGEFNEALDAFNGEVRQRYEYGQMCSYLYDYRLFLMEAVRLGGEPTTHGVLSGEWYVRMDNGAGTSSTGTWRFGQDTHELDEDGGDFLATGMLSGTRFTMTDNQNRTLEAIRTTGGGNNTSSSASSGGSTSDTSGGTTSSSSSGGLDAGEGSSSSGGSSSGGGGYCANGLYCQIDRQCGGGAVCRVPDGGAEGCCVGLLCTADSDCEAPQTCNTLLGLCAEPTCDPTSALTCPAGSHCVNDTVGTTALQSRCVPDAPRVDACVVHPQSVVLRPLDGATLDLAATLAGRLVAHARPTWSSSADNVVGVSGPGELQALVPGVSTITATLGEVTCTATVRVLPAAAAMTVRAVVLDARSGAPLSGVPVQLRTASGTPPTQNTDALGVALFSNVTDAVAEITAFAPAHTWVTYVRPNVTDLVFHLEPTAPAGRAVGTRARLDLSTYSPPADVQVGLGGLSHPDVFGAPLGALDAPPVAVDISIPSVGIEQQDVPFPGNASMVFAGTPIRDTLDLHAAGACSGAHPCAPLAWALGARLALSRIGPVLAGLSGGLEASLPVAVLDRPGVLRHAVLSGVTLEDAVAPAALDAPAWTNTVTLGPVFPMTRSVLWRLPALPTLPSGIRLAAATLMQSAWVAGSGGVPLGVTLARDTCEDGSETTCALSPSADGFISCADRNATSANECDGLFAGDARLQLPVPHDGLEGRPLLDAAVARHEGSLTGVGPTSTLLQAGAGAVNLFADGGFVGFAATAFDRAQRTVTAPGHVVGAAFYRLEANGSAGGWLVYVPADGAALSTELPAPPQGAPDRTEHMTVKAFATRDQRSLQSLLAAGQVHTAGLLEHVRGFSTSPCLVPQATSCTDGSVCLALGSQAFCDVSGVCVDEAQGITPVPGGGACAEGKVKAFVGGASSGPAVCSVPPACLDR